MRITLIIAILAASCDSGSPSMIDRVEACEQQADAWCSKSGFDTSGCRISYVESLCATTDRDQPIAMEAQAACLQAIDRMATPARWHPDSCMETWR